MPLHQARNVARIKAKTTEAADLNIDGCRTNSSNFVDAKCRFRPFDFLSHASYSLSRWEPSVPRLLSDGLPSTPKKTTEYIEPELPHWRLWMFVSSW